MTDDYNKNDGTSPLDQDYRSAEPHKGVLFATRDPLDSKVYALRVHVTALDAIIQETSRFAESLAERILELEDPPPLRRRLYLAITKARSDFWSWMADG